LARRPKEAALEAELPIIDPHHHFWDTPQRGRALVSSVADANARSPMPLPSSRRKATR
jgi:predicted TIM-barrel fold metal-dependent hydrolase